MQRRDAVRRILAASALPLIGGCNFDRLLQPSLSTASGSSITLALAGDQHALDYKVGRAVSSVARMVQRVLDADPSARAVTLGDLVPNGFPEEYATGYDPIWGPFLARTHCVPGNHDRLKTGNLNAYYDYVGERGGPRGKGYYAVDLGLYWRAYFLNTEVLHGEQLGWLRADLAAQAGRRHVLACWHVPVLVSMCQHNQKAMTYGGGMRYWWQELEQAGAELVVSGHVHRYERFPRALAGSVAGTGMVSGTASADGVRQFVVGTGGAGTMPILTKHPLSQVQVINRGLFQLDLYPDHYEWTFTDIGGVQRDQGTQACRRVLA